MRYLIGIDDTDNLDSRGTGAHARHLGALLAEAGLAVVEGITRHQLLVAPEIPYTSHNSSACLLASLGSVPPAVLADFCRAYLVRESAAGADAGLCLAAWPAVAPVVQEFGEQAKRQVVTHAGARDLARRADILLEGLTGDGGGVIGALAAVGLRASGNDGRFLWLAGLRELHGIYTAGQLYQTAGIEAIRSLDGAEVPVAARIDVSPWPRPVLSGGQAVLLVEEVRDDEQCEWRILPRDIIRQY